MPYTQGEIDREREIERERGDRERVGERGIERETVEQRLAT